MMKIEISLDTKDAADLAALMALVKSIGTEVHIGTTGDLRHELTLPVSEIAEGPPIVPPGYLSGVLDFPPESDEPLADLNPPALDSRGIPWDKRIHASTKARNTSDDTWRNMRGVNKDLLAAVEAELFAARDASTVLPEPPVPNVPEPAATVSGAADVAGASEIPLPPAPAAEEAAGTIPDAPAAPTPADAPTFKDAMAIVTTRQREGTLTQVQVSEAAQALGLSSVVDLAKPANAEHIAAFIALLG